VSATGDDRSSSARFDVDLSGNRLVLDRVDASGRIDHDPVMLDAASARDLTFFLPRVLAEPGAAVSRPVVVLRNGVPYRAHVTITQVTGGQWRLDLDDVRAVDDRGDADEGIDARLADLSTMVWLTDADRLARWFNPSWLEFVGRALDEQLGWGWMQRIHPDDLVPLLEAYEAAQEERRCFEHVGRVADRDERYRWVLTRAAPRFAGDDFAGFVGLCEVLAHDAEGAAPELPRVADLYPADVLRDLPVARVVERLTRLGTALEVSRPAVVAEAVLLRKLASRWILQHDVLSARHDEMVLAVGEAAANAAVHAYRDGKGRVALQCDVDAKAATMRVRDWGAWKQPAPHGDGRGLLIMDALCDELTVHHDAAGTEVVLAFDIA
jgi:anti-sigma regulatory factor (Ser/Thr protein kinase)/PAS domain-containing protein